MATSLIGTRSRSSDTNRRTTLIKQWLRRLSQRIENSISAVKMWAKTLQMNPYPSKSITRELTTISSHLVANSRKMMSPTTPMIPRSWTRAAADGVTLEIQPRSQQTLPPLTQTRWNKWIWLRPCKGLILFRVPPKIKIWWAAQTISTSRRTWLSTRRTRWISWEKARRALCRRIIL